MIHMKYLKIWGVEEMAQQLGMLIVLTEHLDQILAYTPQLTIAYNSSLRAYSVSYGLRGLLHTHGLHIYISRDSLHICRHTYTHTHMNTPILHAPVT